MFDKASLTTEARSQVAVLSSKRAYLLTETRPVDFFETGSRKVYATGFLPLSRSSLVPGEGPGLSLWSVERGSIDPALVESLDKALEFSDSVHILFDEDRRNMTALIGDSLGTPTLWIALTDLACGVPAL
ncbi:hypothetical protein FOZ60_008631 [Perkinsus olseni]|uniref:Uncharacterized protein n=1 Tax=Perkinsus olseni TaxID=32597 RepID=A0A7J6NIQ5_PEROL|nr:hypothetical protein FOZ60_008631 [Perkinsus olseni]